MQGERLPLSFTLLFLDKGRVFIFQDNQEADKFEADKDRRSGRTCALP